jgi:hypothetical protein
MSKIKRHGVCKLTQSFGPYVDSHIIPLSLTRLSRTGEKYIEAGIGHGVKKRSNSWYDGALVTRQGEDILSDIDSKAINELRKHRLIWNSWKSEQRLHSEDILHEDGRPLYRLIRLERPEVLRVFFLSLLWRAAASTRPEFSKIALQDSIVEDLRHRILKEEPGPSADYPIQLFQIITRGVEHNRTPLLERKPIILDANGSSLEEIAYVRFYFDGLVAHINIPDGQSFGPHFLNTCLGFQDNSIVFLHEYDDSRASADIKEMVTVVHQEQMTPVLLKDKDRQGHLNKDQ